jgi:hypothetical protein
VQKALSPDERLLLQLMLASSEWVVEAKRSLLPDDLKDPVVKMIVAKIYEFFVAEKEISTAVLVNAFSDRATRSVLTRLAQDDIVLNDQPKMFADCLKSIRGYRLKEQRQRLREEIVLAEKAGNWEAVRSLQEQFNLNIRT